VPLAALGLAFGKLIKTHLFRAETVAITSILGAFVIFAVERWYRRKGRPRIESVDDLRPVDALKVGIAQAFALLPGTSRSGATIIGGLMFGLSRQAATEFSFFLAIPTLLIASAYQLVKERGLFSTADIGWMGVGLVAAFASAFLCVRWLLRYIATHDFTPFAWYRIAFGVIVLWTSWSGLIAWSGAG
jgi:undecaprenyl-diphosphatase